VTGSSIAPDRSLRKVQPNQLGLNFVAQWLTNDDSRPQALTRLSTKIYDKLLKQ
jgi:hypothetical protein